MNMAASTVYAYLLKDPTPPKQGQYGASHMVTVQLDGSGEEVKIWFDVGPLSALKAGDWVVCEWYNGKWKLSRTQAPELMAELAQRAPQQHAAPPTQPPRPPMQQPAPSAPPTHSAPAAQTPAPKAGIWDEAMKQRINAELGQRAALLAHCHRTIAAQFLDANNNVMVSDDIIQRYATTLYIDLTGKI